MYKGLLILLLPLSLLGQKQEGFIDFTWDDDTGQVLLHVPADKLGEEFLYVSSLSAGIGSNDIGLDRGQLGNEKVVHFYRSGKTVLMIQNNLKYRAISDNAKERNAVDEAFAKSVIFGFKIVGQDANSYQLDATPFLIRDAHGVSKTLKDRKQGHYKLDKTRSAVYKEGLFNFPDNTELEALLTFSGEGEADFISSVTPTPELVTVRQHHSFVRLPDDKYQPRKFHSESGYIFRSYYDYAAPIGTDMEQRFILRHRLNKKTPGADLSPAIEPIIYYIDSGCPEPVKSALIEGGNWWNQAFEAAGYKDAFEVRELPEGAHPLDVRYNMIQWVHRSTRGWSYGASVADPRTGEIIKGHVSLGSLRVRQDYLIAQGIISAFDESSEDPRILEMALARLRQLSAHEIGHTIGLTHNFAASYNDRSSVMDYPHPYVVLDEGDTDFSSAYDNKIGEWDKRTITYGYGSPATGQSEADYLRSIIEKNRKDGLLFITDKDARPAGGMHPYAHLWDNGNDPVGELERICTLRKHVLSKLGVNSIKEGTPYSEIEKVLVPVYLMHRYQVDGASKIIGGVGFDYGVKPTPLNFTCVDVKEQKRALTAILSTLDTEFLKLSDELIESIPPPAYGYPKNRESFRGHTGALFDPLSAAEAAAGYTLSFLLDPQRLARLDMYQEGDWTLKSYMDQITSYVQGQTKDAQYQMMLEKVLFITMLKIKADATANKQVKAMVMAGLNSFFKVEKKTNYSGEQQAHRSYLRHLLSESTSRPETFDLPDLAKMPPGSPIGCH